MSDRDSLKVVLAWSGGGLAVSAVALTALLTGLGTPQAGEVVVERAIHNMDRDTCERVLRSFADQANSGSRVLWLWAEESTPGAFTGAGWTRRVARSPDSPRPYAFDPAAQPIPEEACSFPNNSLHIVSVERGKEP